MARKYSSSKRASALRLYGFEDFVEALSRAEKIEVDKAAEKCFDQCCDIAVQSMDEKMARADVPTSLQNAATKFRVKRNNIFMFSYGWKKSDEETFNKVCYLNYGTPVRYSSKGYRGRIKARGFISNAKRSAAQRMKKAQKDALKEIMEGLKG